MRPRTSEFEWRALIVLHLVFALTGIVQAIGGSLLPSIAMRFRLADRESGLLFLLCFAGASLGAILCRRNYARILALSFLMMAGCCLGITLATHPILPIAFFLFGISNGIPMSAVNLFAGHSFADRCAPMLTFLNFSWSAGAFAAPLIAARILTRADYRPAYLLLAAMAAAASLACALFLHDGPVAPRAPSPAAHHATTSIIVLFGFAAFLQVGIENTVVTWLASYIQRMAITGAAHAAATSSLYFAGFLGSRGASAVVLLRADASKILRAAVFTALSAALLLFVLPTPTSRDAAMLVLGAALAPIYPLLIATFFARARHSSDARWILATAGLGGSVLPWLTGWVSSHAGNLRSGMFTIPTAIALLAFLLPAMRPRQSSSQGVEAAAE